MKIERKVLVRRIYDSYEAENFQSVLQRYLDDGWEIEQIHHAGQTFCVILYRFVEQEFNTYEASGESCYE